MSKMCHYLVCVCVSVCMCPPWKPPSLTQTWTGPRPSTTAGFLYTHSSSWSSDQRLCSEDSFLLYQGFVSVEAADLLTYQLSHHHCSSVRHGFALCVCSRVVNCTSPRCCGVFTDDTPSQLSPLVMGATLTFSWRCP